MATQILPVSKAAASSASFTVAANATLNVFMTSSTPFPTKGGAAFGMWIDQQASDNSWSPVYSFRSPDNLTATLPPGVYRARREASVYATGLQRA